MNSTLYQAIYKLMLSLVKLLLRKGVAFSEFVQVLKQAYVEVAERQLLTSEGKATTSRIAIVTGLTRKDVAQLRKLPLTPETISSKYNRATRVISGWLEDSEFCTLDGYPEVLLINGKEKSFEALVNRYSGDMTTKAMLDELERVGVIKRIEKKHVSLQRRAYIPAGDEDEAITILGTDVALLISTIDHNMTHDNEALHFQRKVCYDNLPEDCLEEFQSMVNQDGQHLLEKLNQWLAQHDRDANPDAKGDGQKRAGVGIYYFEEQVVKQDPQEEKS
jgi:hypothetical protein